MPKETVYGDQVAYEPPGDSHQQVPIVDVLWHRDLGYVQIVTKATDASGGRWIGELTEDSHVTDGMYVNLDRGSINKLIRDLRRARDQSFGRDE